MNFWTILKRAWYFIAYNGRFSFKPAEMALLDAVLVKLPADDVDALQTQLRSLPFFQRFNKGRMVYLGLGRYNGPLLSKKDNPCCVARVEIRMTGETMVASVVSMRGVLRILYFPNPPDDSPVEVGDVFLYPLHRAAHGSEWG
jgi:hypothetical protein